VPAWDDLLNEFAAVADDQKASWLMVKMNDALANVADLRDRNVLLWGSAFLQKPQVPAQTIMITNEDLNGLMSTIYQMAFDKGLTLMLHTPGGDPNAANSTVQYLRSKFPYVEVIVPTLAMSAGTMISLSCDRVIMGRQSQLGPIDPQFTINGRGVSAQAVVEQFNQAKTEILTDQRAAHAWAPILTSLGPALLQEAQNALAYSESMVSGWLSTYMWPGDQAKGEAIAKHFNDHTTHKSHGRRINRDEARTVGVTVDDLEDSQPLQEAVLTAYHLMTIFFEQSPCVRMMWSNAGRNWIKNYAG
jgi:hypothetical protein